jgi:hypothetical protein
MVETRVWGVRYLVSDVQQSIAFYTTHLGFTLDQQAGTAFAKVSCDGLALLLRCCASRISRTRFRSSPTRACSFAMPSRSVRAASRFRCWIRTAIR